MEDVINMIGNQVYHIYVYVYIYMYHQPDVILYVGIIYYFANHLRDIMVYITTKPTNNMDYLYIYIDQLLVCGKHAGDQESRAECNQIYIYIYTGSPHIY